MIYNRFFVFKMEDFFRCFYSPHLICRYDAAAEASKRSMDYSQLPGEPTTRCPRNFDGNKSHGSIWVFALGEKHNSKTLGVWFQVQLHGGRVWSRASGADFLGCFMINLRVTKTFPWLRGKGGVMIPQNKGQDIIPYINQLINYWFEKDGAYV